jgi:hypothetical protein
MGVDQVVNGGLLRRFHVCNGYERSLGICSDILTIQLDCSTYIRNDDNSYQCSEYLTRVRWLLRSRLKAFERSHRAMIISQVPLKPLAVF